MAQGEPVVVVVGGQGQQPLAAAEHLVVDLGIEAIQAVVLAAVVVDLHGEQPLQPAVIPPVLKGPVGVVVVDQKPQPVHPGNVLVKPLQVPVGALRQGRGLLFPGVLLGVCVQQVQVVGFGNGPGMVRGALLRKVHLQTCQRQEILVVKLCVVGVFPVVCKGHNGVALGLVGLFHLLGGEFPIGQGGVAVEICLEIAGLRQKNLIFHE